jgi:hypothetical protein
VLLQDSVIAAEYLGDRERYDHNAHIHMATHARAKRLELLERIGFPLESVPPMPSCRLDDVEVVVTADDTVPPQLRCAITKQPVRNPVVTIDSKGRRFVFDRPNILETLRKRAVNPLSGEPLSESSLVFDRALQAELDAFNAARASGRPTSAGSRGSGGGSGGGGGGGAPGGSPLRPAAAAAVKMQYSWRHGGCVDDDLCCPVTLELFVDPVKAPSGHTFERAVILQALERKAVNPITALPLTAAELTPDTAMAARVAEYRAARGISEPPAAKIAPWWQ